MSIWQFRVAIVVSLVIWSIIMSDDADYSSVCGRCSVCRRSMQIRLDGLIRNHGPAKNRCQGSKQPPASHGNSSAIPMVGDIDSTLILTPVPYSMVPS